MTTREVRETNEAAPRRDRGSVLQALEELRLLSTEAGAVGDARAPGEPSTGLLDVRAMAALVHQQVAARRAAALRRPASAAGAPKVAPKIAPKVALGSAQRRAPVRAPVRAPGLTPVAAFMLGVVGAAVLMGTSALVGVAWV